MSGANNIVPEPSYFPCAHVHGTKGRCVLPAEHWGSGNHFWIADVPPSEIVTGSDGRRYWIKEPNVPKAQNA